MNRSLQFVLSLILVLGAASCGSRERIPLVETQSADKMLFDRGTEAFAAQRYQEAITLFATLINAYPDSKYVERANLVLIDCDGVKECASVQRQVKGYPDAPTFFPDMPEDRRLSAKSHRLTTDLH
jgi:TolA-binding protein